MELKILQGAVDDELNGSGVGRGRGREKGGRGIGFGGSERSSYDDGGGEAMVWTAGTSSHSKPYTCSG